jgi:putative Holliday junction resolvase
MNGSEGPQAQKVKAFVGELLKRHPVPILLWDERLSTQAVTRTMIAADLSRKRQKEVVDKMAASYILQGVLDALR